MFPYAPVYRGPYAAMVPYGTLNLTETSPPQSFTEPLTVAEIEGHLLLPTLNPPDITQQTTIEAMIPAAREQGEILQGKDLVRKQWDLSLDYWGCSGVIELRAPTVSVELVQYKDSNGNVTVLTEGVDYVVDLAKQPGIIVPAFNTTWPSFTPWPSSAILVRFTAGYSDTSAFWADAGSRVKIGMKQLISGWFNGRIPWAIGAGAASEYPYAVTACLTAGSVPRAR